MQKFQDYYEQLFAGFDGRDDDLKKIKRFGTYYKPWHYRTSVYEHSRRMYFLISSMETALQKLFGDRIDTELMKIMALVHDDVEIVIGDITGGDKALMSPAQLQEIADREARAVELLTARFPKMVGGYSYETLLTQAHSLDTIESRLVKYVDRLDAFGETLHEIFSGNPVPTSGRMSEMGAHPSPYEYYINYFNDFPKKNPGLVFISTTGHPLLIDHSTDLDFTVAVAKGQLHTKETLPIATGYTLYDAWKQAVLDFGDEADILYLITPTE